MSFTASTPKVVGDEPVNQIEQNDEEPLDPRIQIELERANAATSEINNLETQLDEAQKSFQNSFTNCKQKLAILAKKLGSCVERARPYYDAFKSAEEAQIETQKAAQDYQRSVELYRVAKETLSLAESKLLTSDKRDFDTAWQEYVNHATMKVMQAEQEKTRSERLHEEKSKLYQENERQRISLQNSLKRSIAKSKSYFDAKEQLEFELQNQKLRIEAVQKAISQAKKMYRAALNNLERISEEIHFKRKSHFLKNLPPREPGVGSEKPDDFIEMPKLGTLTERELTEFPKIDPSDDEEENEEVLSNSISSISIDGCSINQSTQPTSVLCSQATSDYESFADCLRQASPIEFTAEKSKAGPFSNEFSPRSRINGTSKLKNETPLLSHLVGTHRTETDSSQTDTF